MTHTREELEKAIKHYECERDGAIVVLDSGFGSKPGESDLLYRKRKERAQIAVDAIKKQMPKKPIRANMTIMKNGGLYLDDDNEFWKCPVCTQYTVPLLEKQEHCHCCGQAINWED